MPEILKVNIQNLIIKEQEKLREEILHLKKCQTEFAILGITMTAILFGYITMGKPNSTEAHRFLIPLAILLPIWCIFLYKAFSVNRIIAYYAILEELLLCKTKGIKYIGWESSMREFRKFHDENVIDLINDAKSTILDERKKGSIWIFLLRVISLFIPLRPYGYWELVNSVFFWLSITCIVLAGFPYHAPLSVLSDTYISIQIALGFFIIISCINTMLIITLKHGKNSTEGLRDVWMKILNEDTANYK